MSSSRRSVEVSARDRRRFAGRFRSGAALVALVVAAGIGITMVAVRPGLGTDLLAAERMADVPVAAPVVPPGTSAASGSPSPGRSAVSGSPSSGVVPVAPSSAPPVLRLSGPVPSAGRGTWEYDDRPGPVLGHAGPVRRFRVAVEVGAEEDVAAFGDEVQAALGDPGSWTGGGQLRMRRVPAGSPYDFTVYLATARTAGRMCLAGGVNIRVGGVPYTSCRAPGQVIINLDRWRLSVPHLVELRVPLARYRTYVVNHEVGHQLGHRHERCPGRGRPAPVMMQQTLFLDGCVANPWPFLDGRRYAGPRI